MLAEADAAKASLYTHFGSKDELVAAHVERRIAAARAHIDAYLADTPPGQRALRFFDWAYANGDKMAEDLDYVPMPPAVEAAIRKSWGAIQAEGKPVYAGK